MNRKLLFKEINELCLKLDSAYNINDGGCCFVAACIAKQLEKYNIPFTVIHYNLWGCHYAIKVDDRYLNRCDYRKKEIGAEIKCNSSYVYDIYTSKDWNPRYNSKNNKTIEKYIIELFEKYENCRT